MMPKKFFGKIYFGHNPGDFFRPTGAERFFRDPEEKKPARIVILKTSEPPE